MNKFVVSTFPDQMKIDEAITTLRKLHSGRSIKLYASALVAKDTDGRLSAKEITTEGHSGTAVGALIGALAGLPAGPAAAAIMGTSGAVIGNAADSLVEGDFTSFANSIASEIAPGGKVIVAELAEDSVPAFLIEGLLAGAEGLHSHASLSQQRRDGFKAIGHRIVHGGDTFLHQAGPPTAYPTRGYVGVGGLMSYGPNFPASFRRAADYVHKILLGAKPGSARGAAHYLVVNLTTTKALDLTIPESFLLRADEVIE